jgi:SAM-dependent methyltransferase
MTSTLAALLRCPFCGGDLDRSGENYGGDMAGFAVLSCYCGRYPVVAGIPVLKKGVITPTGQTADDVVHLIEAGRHREALISMLMPRPPASATMAPSWLQRLPAIKGTGFLKSLAGQPAQHAWRKRALAFLTHLGDHVTACDLFDFHFCYLTGDGREPYSYYAFRFGQPRHLVALSLASLIQTPTRPVLEVGCGFGHITRSLTARAPDQLVIGLDHTFFGLYVAKHWMAPGAEYVCAEADTGLPFADGTFSVGFCSDAFHWFRHKATSFRELLRLTRDDGFVILATVRNGLLENHLYRGTLPPAGYQQLAEGISHCLIANSDILARYLKKHGPPLAQSTDLERLAPEPWLSVVAAHRPEILRDHGPFDDWPHAEGCLALNPLYTEAGHDSRGNVQLRRAFPSPWYEKENGECRQYQPDRVSISSTLLADLVAGKRTPEIETLIEQYVVLGMPERFR